MKVGVLGAVPEEVELLNQDLAAAGKDIVGNRTYRFGRLYGQEVILAHARMGKVAAAITATRLLETYGADLVLFVGVAGAVAPDVSIGDIVVASELMQHDMDARPLFPRYEIPLLDSDRFTVDPDLIEGALEAAQGYIQEDLPRDISSAQRESLGLTSPKALSGLIVSGDQFIHDPRHLAEIHRHLPDAKCVEMEGAAVAQVCAEHQIPCLVIRTVSDRADGKAGKDFSVFIEQAARYYSRGIVRRLFSLF